MTDAAENKETTSDHLQKVSEALETGTLYRASRMLNALHPAEIADLLEAVPHNQRAPLWKLVNKDNESDVLIELGDEIRNELIKDMSPEQLSSVAEGMDVDDSADFVQALPDKVIDQVLHSLDSQHRERLEQVLSFTEDSAGGLMNTDTITVRPEVTLDVVLRYLRLLGEIPDLTDNLIVVDRDNHFLGTLPLSRLLVTDPQSNVGKVMDNQSQPIPSDTLATEVAKMFENYDLISAPVVDTNNHLLGRITIDDVVDVIREEADHSVLSMAGLNDEEDLFAPIIPSSKRRALWLGINLLTAILASWVVSYFETTLQKVVTVAVLMNIVASMGGIAGSQTLTLVIRGIALGQVNNNNQRWILNKEIMVSLFNGVLWACVIAGVTMVWFRDIPLGFVIAGALITNLLVAALSGVAIPIILRKLNIDPAIAGSVILTTMTDIIGLFVFLGLATVFLL